MTPEKRIQNKIVDYLNKLQSQGAPIFVERRNAGGFSYKKGIPDLYAIINGWHVEIEVKQPGGELEPMQEKFRQKCERLNIMWVCATCVKDVDALVDAILYGRRYEL